MGFFIRGGPERRSLNISHRLNPQEQKTLENAACVCGNVQGADCQDRTNHGLLYGLFPCRGAQIKTDFYAISRVQRLPGSFRIDRIAVRAFIYFSRHRPVGLHQGPALQAIPISTSESDLLQVPYSRCRGRYRAFPSTGRRVVHKENRGSACANLPASSAQLLFAPVQDAVGLQAGLDPRARGLSPVSNDYRISLLAASLFEARFFGVHGYQSCP